jgi:uncharacterized glyoxalase superfamily protein PhnB
MGMSAERAVPIIPIDDVEVAKRFYVDGLGFRVTGESGDGAITIIDRGTIHVTLDCPMDGHGRNICVGLEVNDADALYEEWRKRVPIDRPPMNQDWGARTFGVTDPFGNGLFVMGPLT